MRVFSVGVTKVNENECFFVEVSLITLAKNEHQPRLWSSFFHFQRTLASFSLRQIINRVNHLSSLSSSYAHALQCHVDGVFPLVAYRLARTNLLEFRREMGSWGSPWNRASRNIVLRWSFRTLGHQYKCFFLAFRMRFDNLSELGCNTSCKLSQ